MPATVPNQYAAHIGSPTLTPVCTGEADLMIYDAFGSDGAWIAMQEALFTREYR